MRTTRHGLALAGLTALAAFGTAAFAGAAEAGSKHKHHGVTVIIGDGGYGYYGRNRFYGYRTVGYGCGYLLDRFEATGNPKWYRRWKNCRNGW